MNHKHFSIIIVLLSLFFHSNAFSGNASFRCGSDLISLGATMHEVRSSCGEPHSSDIVGERSIYKFQKNRKYKVESNYYITEWIYEGNNGIYALTFEGSRLVKKEFIFQ
jgi:hypothetical protein